MSNIMDLKKDYETNEYINDYAEKNTQSRKIKSIKKINDNTKYHLRGNLDIMSHTLKGNMGLFISAGKNIYLHNVSINGIHNNGPQNKI